MNQRIVEDIHIPIQGYSFGPFSLAPERRLLMKDGVPVKLRGREFDTLLALVEKAGQFLSKDELAERIWPTVTVSENNLRVQIGALRRALGDVKGSSRYIVTVNGRGYCFCHDVQPVRGRDFRSASLSAQSGQADQGLPDVKSLIGRSADIARLVDRMPLHRLLTIVGEGGLGKTSLAAEVARKVAPDFDDGVRWVDLAAIGEASEIMGSIAACFGLPLASVSPLEDLLDLLGDMQVLIVLDNCEHLVDAAADIVNRLLRSSRSVSILATSREPLRTDGETLYRLLPLGLPDEEKLSIEQAMAFPAIRLFVERARAGDNALRFTDADVEALMCLCRELDGNPLAIELAAARAGHFSVQGLASRLGASFNLLTHGRRTSAPRHQTLRATLDWSYDLLTRREQSVLQQLSIFRGAFTIESARAVVQGDAEDGGDGLIPVMAELKAKCLLTVEASGVKPVYRLLYLTRTYAAEKLVQGGHAHEIARRHARDCLTIIREVEGRGLLPPAAIDPDLALRVDDIRAAIEWSFSPDGDIELGVDLLSGALNQNVKLTLCRDYCDLLVKACEHIQSAADPNPRVEVRLQIARYILHIHAHNDACAEQAIADRVLALSEILGEDDIAPVVETLLVICAQNFSAGNYPEMLRFGRRLENFARFRRLTGYAKVHAERVMAQAQHFMGAHSGADTIMQRILSYPEEAVRLPGKFVDEVINPHITLRIFRARSLWVRGYAGQATVVADEALDMARRTRGYVSCYALAFGALPVAAWRGQIDRLRQCTDLLGEIAQADSLEYWAKWWSFWDATLSYLENIDRLGTVAVDDRFGIFGGLNAIPVANVLQGDTLPTLHYSLLPHETVARTEAGTVGWCVPEVLRAQGERIRQVHGDPQQAEDLFRRALNLAGRQGAKGFALRSAVSLGRLMLSDGRRAQVRAVVGDALDQIREGLADRDASEALRLIEAAEH